MLSHPIAPGATASWSITTPNAPITPLQGNGSSATLTSTSGVGTSALPGSQATLDFTITGCGITKTISKTFFVGRPDIKYPKIDGYDGSSRTVCPGWHNLSATVLGDDTNPFCITWELINNTGTPPHTLYDTYCGSTNIYMNPFNGYPAFVRLTATNECGPYRYFMTLYPYDSHCGKEYYYFMTYPNPANSVLNLEVVFDDGQNPAISMPIKHVQLVNMMGVTALDIPNIDSDAVEVNLSSVPDGLYVARVQVGDEWLTKNVQVSKN